MEFWGPLLTKKINLELTCFSRLSQTFSCLNLKHCWMTPFLIRLDSNFDRSFLQYIMLKTYSWTVTAQQIKFILMLFTEFTLKHYEVGIRMFSKHRISKYINEVLSYVSYMNVFDKKCTFYVKIIKVL